MTPGMGGKARIVFIFLVGVLALLVLDTPQTAKAWGPNTHVTQLDSTLAESDSILADRIRAEPDACLAGLMAPDLAVMYYYTDFKTYDSLHDWNTADRLWELADTEREKVFSICFKLHLAGDAVSHNIYVPYQIRKWKIPNEIIHAISELKIEERYLNEKTPHAFERYPEFAELLEEVTGKNWDLEARILHSAIGGGKFYEEGFSIPEAGFFWGIYRNLAKVVGNFVTDETDIDLMDYSKDLMIEVLDGTDPVLDPAGTAELRSANSEISIWKWIFGFAILGGTYWFLFHSKWMNKYNKRKKK